MNNQNNIDLKSSNDTEPLEKKLESLKQAFHKYDKNLDDYVDFRELIDFLDSLMKPGNNFDRNIAKEILKILDTDRNQKITVEEFIKTFLEIYENLNSQIIKIEKALISEKNKLKNLEVSVREFINEPVNENQIGPNSKFFLEIYNIEFLNHPVEFNNQLKHTNIISKHSDLIWKEKFDL